MTKKRCARCGVRKHLSLFYNRAAAKDGKASECKACRTLICEEWKSRNYEKWLATRVAGNKRWEAANPEKRKAIKKRVFANWRQRNLERERKRVTDWVKANRSRVNARKRQRYATEPNYSLLCKLRARITELLAGRRKGASTLKLLGCSLDSLTLYLESKFQPGMSWENMGEWHLDHIMPCAIFDLTKPEHQKVCFHFSNLQPLWAEDNLKKSASVPPVHQFNLL